LGEQGHRAAAAENLALEFVDRGVHTVSLRFAPTVHGAGDHGFIATIAAVARQKGLSGYPGTGPTDGPPRTESTLPAWSPSACRGRRPPPGCTPPQKSASHPHDRRGDRPRVRPCHDMAPLSVRGSQLAQPDRTANGRRAAPFEPATLLVSHAPYRRGYGCLDRRALRPRFGHLLLFSD
jgi:hypothetical protein